MKPLSSLELENITLYQNNSIVLNDINLTIEPGKIYAIIGEHGSGKSSLCDSIGGRKKFTSGTVTYNNKSYTASSYREIQRLPIAVVSQTYQLLDNFCVAHNLLMPDMLDSTFFFRKTRLMEKARMHLGQYGISLSPASILKNLSQSDKQIIYIIRALIRNPEIILLDASFELLTAPATEHIQKILMQQCRQGKSVIFFTSRIEYLNFFANRVLILKKGKIIWNSRVKDVDRINLIKMCYTEITKDDKRLTSDQEIYELFKFNEAIIHNLPISIIVIDGSYKIRLYNQSAKLFFNLSETINTNQNYSIQDVLGDENQEVWNQIKELIKNETITEIYNSKVSRQGETYTLNIKCFPVNDSSTTIGHMLLIQDISRQEKLREQVILSEKLASVGLLAAGVAHEINNPLEIVYNIISYLKYNIKQHDLLNLLDELEDEISLIKQIISNLISFSDTQKIISEKFDMNKLIERLITLIKINANKRNIQINLEQNDNAYLIANKNEIKQVLLNLFRNSMDAMPTGGVINVSTVSENTSEGSVLTVSIKDTGSGIDEAIIKNIFLPFYSTKKQGKNLGLGLSVSYGIIEKYGGKIEVNNLQDGGCEFKLCFYL
ncbi:MAG: ATP-binding cassette domain-containing protein [Spirochaetes bacterium]|jgi:PAS domain S-box-containing protein|nr:ATP-binding cassette domain-containing protein [Spirochaetota bacterium]